MPTIPNDTLIGQGVPTITLAGQKWPVPLLAPKQNRHVVPLVLKIVPKFIATLEEIAGSDTDGNAVRRTIVSLPKLATVLDEQGYDDVMTIIYWALNRGHPTITKDEFENMPIETMELMDACMVIAKQTGIIKTVKAGEVKAGEA